MSADKPHERNALEATEQIRLFQELFDTNYKAALLEAVRKGESFLVVDFADIAVFNPDLADLLLDQPEEVLRAAEIAIEQFDLPEDNPKIAVRIKNLPKSQEILIRNVRAKHIGKLLAFEGIVRQKSDVRPQVTQAKFECPSCGNIITVLQMDSKFKEPTRCGCGRKGKFRLVHKELVDAQGLVLEEAPERLEGGEQPKRMNVFLKNDLVSPISEKKTNPGQHIKITGVVKEVPIITKSGSQSTRFDLLIEANYVESVEEDYSDIVITPEEEEEIIELSKDPQLVKRLVNSVAPSIFGHEKIKEALVMQMVGGMKKERQDGSVTRGDIHILLIGDPGAGKSQMLKRVAKVAPKARYVSGKGASGAGLCVSPDSIVLTNPGGMEAIKEVVEKSPGEASEFREGVWKKEGAEIRVQSMEENLKITSKNPSALWKLKAPERMIEITLQSGKKIEITANTKLITIGKEGMEWKKSIEIKEGEYIATPRRLIGGSEKRKATVHLIKSNPVVHGVKEFVRNLAEKLAKKYGSKREAARILGIREDKLYHSWVDEKARGNIKLEDLRRLSMEAGERYEDKVRIVSLYNGKKHKLPAYVSKNLLYAAGLIAGDGDLKRSRSGSISVRLSNSNETLQREFRKVLQEEFGLKYDVKKGNEKRPTATRTHSKILGEILMKLGIPESPKSERIEMSNTLLHFENSMLAEYLAGLFDADGSITKRRTKGSNTVSLTSCSEKLIRQVQLSLLRYGVYSTIRKKKPSNGRIHGRHIKWELEIRGVDNIRKFKENIHLRHPDKRRKIEEITKDDIISNTNIDVIPYLAERIKEKLQQKGIPLKKAGWRNNLSREAARRIVKKYKLTEFERITEAEIRWEKVKEKREKKSRYEFVYDLTVENAHNFVVNGILVHNTASVVKDEFLSGWSLEAGALVLANKGICMIDELDKMSIEDRSAMHEALEQQTVTISKANIQATLRAETTVLAAANPKLGRFDPYEPLAKQIALPPTLINRFDLIFPIRDMPDKSKDEIMADFILSLHKNPEGKMPEIPTQLLRKYVAYAKQNIHPKLTEEAVDEIKNYYLKMRGSGVEEGSIKSIPISARQLEALVRLAEASAKMRLSQKVTREDARRAVDLVHFCLTQVGLDPETGQIDIDRISTGITTSERSKIISIREIIHQLEDELGKTIPIEDIIREATAKGIDEEAVDEAIERLKRSGDIFEPKPGFIQRI